MKESIKILPRPIYLDKIRPYIGKNQIKILTGQRRVGKSMILASVAEEIRRDIPNANIIVIDLEDFAYSHITDAESLHEEISRRIFADKPNFIFIDEVQEVEGFDKVVRSLNLDPRNDVYVTGSNSRMLSSEIASRLAGRSIEIRVRPLSYSEFLFFHDNTDSDETLQDYLYYGGLPYLINLPDSKNWLEYVEAIKDAVVFRDVVNRHSIRNMDFLKRLLLFMADNIGQVFTAKRISDYLKSQRLSVGVGSVQSYIEYVEEAYIVNKARRWDLEGKRFFEIGEKLFFEDLGIRNVITGYRPGDIGGLMENAVYNQLRVWGYDVKIGLLGSGREIDFVAERDGERLYIQVAVNVDEPATAEREFGNLMDISDNYRKVLVTLRDSAPNTYKGIEMKSLRRFLMEE